MPRYVDIEKIERELLKEYPNGYYNEEIGEIARDEPGEDVAPVVHGSWIRQPSEIGTIDVEECSVCGCGMTERNQFWNAKYCPYCGAKMDLRV